ncbi:Beta-hexosaminidase A precursor [Microbulbifer aggregans]|uniref:beta-N-acetylhexosaminidase n=1 Tax=Microbulbifer aggregans TaxID=1769779 RepID=A0A1C9WAR2_9GAMM|nr:glycoside hydrolase family 3 N-terminal domain-containing protein [Microbulbifer aggregans]AOS98228.1 Beta-hexosaminidase A precursor [Microbulbifer aggregans]
MMPNRLSKLLRRSGALATAVALVGSIGACGNDATEQRTQILRDKIAQKIMLDIRYFCPDQQRNEENRGRCAEPVTELPAALGQMISDTGIGGIILFADNLESADQIIALNSDLQAAATSSHLGSPLLIGIDQEGGRVHRLPRAEAVAFAGNMAIGATYPLHGDRFAGETAEAMAEQLRVLGFNVNFAPTLDVNSNPDNPVINVRSYSEKPEVVAELGIAAIQAFQQRQVAATVKHFPGHGDTSVDSHTGLPRVDRPLEQARATDLLPFTEAFEQAQPALTMTAHIQYPALDDTTLHSRDGEEIVVPATLSRRILTDLLRDEMGYEGVIVTDSLGMAGISDYFSVEEAVVKTFAAGADIALMPLKIRFPEDIARLDEIIDRAVNAVLDGELSEAEIDTSLARIESLKKDYIDAQWIAASPSQKRDSAAKVLADPQHAQLADELASAAVSAIYPPAEGVLPVLDNKAKKIQVIAPTPAVGEAFRLSLEGVSKAAVEVLDPHTVLEELPGSTGDVLIVASIVPGESAVELGGMEDLGRLRRPPMALEDLYETYSRGLEIARARGQKTVFVTMRSPYEAARFHRLADLHLATFDYKAFIGADDLFQGPIYRALASALISDVLPTGSLPVTVESEEETVEMKTVSGG